MNQFRRGTNVILAKYGGYRYSEESTIIRLSGARCRFLGGPGQRSELNRPVNEVGAVDVLVTNAGLPAVGVPGSAVWPTLVTPLGRPADAGTLDHGPCGRNQVSTLAEEAIRS